MMELFEIGKIYSHDIAAVVDICAIVRLQSTMSTNGVDHFNQDLLRMLLISLCLPFEHDNSVETECHVLQKVGKYTIGVHKIEGAPKGQSMKGTLPIMKSMRRQTGKPNGRRRR